VNYKNENIGTLYVQYDNSIGINLIPDFSFILSSVLKKLMKTVKPLAPIPSIRSSSFTINVPYSDKLTASEIEKEWGTPIQQTFKLYAK
jgi:hypothetical protein